MWDLILICVGLWVAMIVAHALGARLARRFFTAPDARSAWSLNFVAPTSLSIMALLTGFSFNMAEQRYELRRSLLVAEANAISTADYRQRLVAEPERGQLRDLMRDYARNRLEIVMRCAGDPGSELRWSAIAALQDRIWSATSSAVQKPSAAPIVFPLVLATNALFDASEEHRAASESRIPLRAIRVLLLLDLGTCCLLGFVLSSEENRLRLVTSLTYFLIALAMSLIWDLDTPTAGGIQNPIAPLQRAAAQVGASHIATCS
jgi:hypothetical protein